MGAASHNKYNRKVAVIRANHPLFGQIFQIKQMVGENIIIVLADHSRMKIPREWTDIDGEVPSTCSETIYTVSSIRNLLDLVDLLLKR